MKTIPKKLLALGLLTCSIAAPLLSAHPASDFAKATPDKSAPAAETNPAEKTKLQKAVNLVGAMTRGGMRGAVTGLTSRVTQSKDYTSDALGDMVAEFAQIPELADEVFVSIDDTTTTKIVEELTAAVMHMFILNEDDTNPLTKITRIVARLTQTLDIRTASKMRRYTTLITRFLVESINTKMLHACTTGSYSQRAPTLSESILAWFRPVVGATAVLRTLLVEKIIDNRLAAKSITDKQINRTRLVLNGTLGVALNAGANWLNDRLLSLICGKEFFDTHSISNVHSDQLNPDVTYYYTRSNTAYVSCQGNSKLVPQYNAPQPIAGKTYRFNNATQTFCERKKIQDTNVIQYVETHFKTEQEFTDYELIPVARGQDALRRHKTTGTTQRYDSRKKIWRDYIEVDGNTYVFCTETGNYNVLSWGMYRETHFTTEQECRNYEIIPVTWGQASQRRHKTTQVIESYDAATKTWNVVEWQPTEIVDGIRIAFNNRTKTYFYQSNVANNKWTDTKSADKPSMVLAGNLNEKQKGTFAGAEYFRDNAHSPWQRMWQAQQRHNDVSYCFNLCTQTYWRAPKQDEGKGWIDTKSDQLP